MSASCLERKEGVGGAARTMSSASSWSDTSWTVARQLASVPARCSRYTPGSSRVNPAPSHSTCTPVGRICKRLWSPGIDSASLCCLAGPYDKPYVSYRPATLHRLKESIPWNRFLGFLQIRAQNIGYLLYARE